MQHDIVYNTAVTEAEYKSGSEPTKDTTYFALTGELWSVSCEDFEIIKTLHVSPLQVNYWVYNLYFW